MPDSRKKTLFFSVLCLEKEGAEKGELLVAGEDSQPSPPSTLHHDIGEEEECSKARQDLGQVLVSGLLQNSLEKEDWLGQVSGQFWVRLDPIQFRSPLQQVAALSYGQQTELTRFNGQNSNAIFWPIWSLILDPFLPIHSS
eukprot:TRINITY_DN16833_c0_g2_i1.p1 TRINITY_DN16833_c0_g2~~TRINITY_DN16833_c0_g2_i1.p1  ORF type:complete len:141 (-),score=16.39 TRINITY_DN16833_c0_g2_i1:406-828(-)